MAKPRFSSAPCITQRFPRSDHSPALHSRASTCTRQIPSSAVPGYAQDTPKAAHSHSDSSSSLGQSKPWTQEQPLPTPAAARDTTNLLRSTLHLIFWSLRYQYQLPTPWHCRNSPGPGRSTVIPTHSTSHGSQPRTKHPQIRAQHPAWSYLESCCAQESQTSHPSRLLTSSQQL